MSLLGGSIPPTMPQHDTKDLVSLPQAALDLGMSISLFYYHKREHPKSFPRPIVELPSGKLYSLQEIRIWHAGHAKRGSAAEKQRRAQASVEARAKTGNWGGRPRRRGNPQE